MLRMDNSKDFDEFFKEYMKEIGIDVWNLSLDDYIYYKKEAYRIYTQKGEQI